MEFIVTPISEDDVQKGGPDNYTMCVLCSENPKWCY